MENYKWKSCILHEWSWIEQFNWRIWQWVQSTSASPSAMCSQLGECLYSMLHFLRTVVWEHTISLPNHSDSLVALQWRKRCSSFGHGSLHCAANLESKIRGLRRALRLDDGGEFWLRIGAYSNRRDLCEKWKQWSAHKPCKISETRVYSGEFQRTS